MFDCNTKKSQLINLILASLILLISSCETKIHTENFNSVFTEPCMLVNFEQDNTIEGKYLCIESIENYQNGYIVKINMPDNFYVDNTNCNWWLFGVGSKKAYYDAGVENLWKIISVDKENKTICLGSCVRGDNVPQINQNVVFLNTAPSGFINYIKHPIIDENQWPGFNGNEIYFGGLVFDSILNHYYMIFNEASLTEIRTYIAYSDNLVDWFPANNSEPLFTSADFEHSTWAGKDITGHYNQTPYSSELIRHNNKWYLFLYGYKNGKRQIGLAISDSTVLGPYNILKDPIIANGQKNSWNEYACLSARVAKYKNGFIMFFNAINAQSQEQLGVAWSNDLIHWQEYEKNPILSNDAAWRSCDKVAEPNYIEIKGDSIFVIVLGSKAFKDGIWYRYVTKNAYMDKSGNVDDNQYGTYLSIDDGRTLIPHTNNPIFINDYSNIYEDSHLGGGFKHIKTDTSEFIIYQAKTAYRDMGYNIMIRERKLNYNDLQQKRTR